MAFVGKIASTTFSPLARAAGIAPSRNVWSLIVVGAAGLNFALMTLIFRLASTICWKNVDCAPPSVNLPVSSFAPKSVADAPAASASIAHPTAPTEMSRLTVRP